MNNNEFDQSEIDSSELQARPTKGREVDGYTRWCIKDRHSRRDDYCRAIFEIMNINSTGLVRLECIWAEPMSGWTKGNKHHSAKEKDMLGYKTVDPKIVNEYWCPVTNIEWVLFNLS